MDEDDGRDLEVHGSDANLQVPESLKFRGSPFVEVENVGRAVVLDVLPELGIGFDLLGSVLGSGFINYPSPGLLFVCDDGCSDLRTIYSPQTSLEFRLRADSSNCTMLRESVSRTTIRRLYLPGFLLGGLLLGRSLLGLERIPPLATVAHGLIEGLGIVCMAAADLLPPGHFGTSYFLQFGLQTGHLCFQAVDLPF